MTKMLFEDEVNKLIKNGWRYVYKFIDHRIDTMYIEDDIVYFVKRTDNGDSETTTIFDLKTKNKIRFDYAEFIYCQIKDKKKIFIKISDECLLLYENCMFKPIKIWQESDERYTSRDYGYKSTSYEEFISITCNNEECGCGTWHSEYESTYENAINNRLTYCFSSKMFLRNDFMIVNNNEIWVKFSMDTIKYFSLEQQEITNLADTIMLKHKLPKPLRNIIHLYILS